MLATCDTAKAIGNVIDFQVLSGLELLGNGIIVSKFRQPGYSYSQLRSVTFDHKVSFNAWQCEYYSLLVADTISVKYFL